jgi:hypothetical protein
VNSGKSELCNLVDDNCDGQTDEGNVYGSASTFAKTSNPRNSSFLFESLCLFNNRVLISFWFPTFAFLVGTKKKEKKFEQTVKFLKLTNFRPNFKKL